MDYKTIKQRYESILDDLDDIQEGLCETSQSEYGCLIFREKAYRLAIKLLDLEKEQIELSFHQFKQFVLTSPVVRDILGCDPSQWIGGNRSYKSSLILYAKELVEGVDPKTIKQQTTLNSLKELRLKLFNDLDSYGGIDDLSLDALETHLDQLDEARELEEKLFGCYGQDTPRNVSELEAYCNWLYDLNKTGGNRLQPMPLMAKILCHQELVPMKGDCQYGPSPAPLDLCATCLSLEGRERVLYVADYEPKKKFLIYRGRV